MRRYELISLVARLGQAGAVVAAVQRATPAPQETLHGIWISELGPLNHVYVLRSHLEDGTAAAAPTVSKDLFGCADALDAVHVETYDTFPGVPVLPPGAWGTYYEIRTYVLKEGGLAPTLDAWRLALPARTAAPFSPLAIALYAREGPPRITHIWPYRSLDERLRIRSESVRHGVWPPTGAPAWLTSDMRSTVCLPAEPSPWH